MKITERKRSKKSLFSCEMKHSYVKNIELKIKAKTEYELVINVIFAHLNA